MLTKSIGTNNPINQVKATMAGLRSLRKPQDVAELRGLTIRQVLGMPKADSRQQTADSGSAEGAVDPVAVVAATPAEATADAEDDADNAATEEALNQGNPAEATPKENDTDG